VRQLCLLSAIVLLLVGCGEDTQPSSPTAPRPSQPLTTQARPSVSSAPVPASRGTVIRTAGSEFGQILFDGTGQAIYLFDQETTSRPVCHGPCADAWPPVLTRGPPRPSGGAHSKLLGTTRRTDGSTQVTYAGHPLYFYAHEGKNQVLCHNVSEFGGVWLVVTPRGRAAP